MKKYFNQIAQFVVIPVTFLALQSCATVVGENRRTVFVDSTPRGANIYVEGQPHGTTPATVTLPNYIYGGKLIVLKKEGYRDQGLTVNTQFQKCGLFNILFWPGFLIDGAIGNTVKIDPANFSFTTELQPISN